MRAFVTHMLLSTLVTALSVSNGILGVCTAAPSPAAFMSVKPTRGRLWQSSNLSPLEPVSIDKSDRLRRRSLLYMRGLKDSPDVIEAPTDVSTDEETLETSRRRDGSKPPSSDGPTVWGVPLESVTLLNIAAIIWGTQHAVIKSVVDNISIGPDALVKEWLHGLLGQNADTATAAVVANDGDAAAYFTLARFGLAALLASPYTPGLGAFAERIKAQFGRGIGTGTGQVAHDETESLALSTDLKSLITPHQQNPRTKHDENLSWRYGIELGIYMFLGYAFQAIGLETTTASRSGFFLYLNVKLVPFFSYLLFGKQIRPSTLISALVAFCGTALLTLDNSGNTSSELGFGLNTGDLWSMAAAAASAMFILRTETASKAVSKLPELNAASLWTVSMLSFIWTIAITSKNTIIAATTNAQMAQATIRQTIDATLSIFVDHPLQMFYLSAVTTTLANYIQSKGQKNISAERASIIYAMDPVYGALVANLLLGEQLGIVGWVGSGLIFAAAATNAVFDFGPEDDDKQSR